MSGAFPCGILVPKISRPSEMSLSGVFRLQPASTAGDSNWGLKSDERVSQCSLAAPARGKSSSSLGSAKRPTAGLRSLPTHDLSTGNLGSEDPGHGSRPSIDDPSGMRLAFDLAADRVVHNVADPAPKARSRSPLSRQPRRPPGRRRHRRSRDRHRRSIRSVITGLTTSKSCGVGTRDRKWITSAATIKSRFAKARIAST